MQSNFVILNQMGLLKNFEISRVKYLYNKGLGLTNHFDIGIVFEISVFQISKFNCII